MRNKKIFDWYTGSGSSPYVIIDPDAQAFVTAAGITADYQKMAIDVLTIGLKAQGIWTKCTAIYPFLGGNASAHKYNLKDPRDLDAAFRLVFAGSWFHSNSGIKPNGTDTNARTLVIPNTHLSQNNTHLSIHTNTDSNAAEVEIGARSTNYCILEIRTTNVTYPLINQSTVVGYADTDARGYYVGSRLSSTVQKGFKNGAVTLTGSASSAAMPTVEIYIGSYNTGGTPTNRSTKEVLFATIGQGLSDSEATALYTLENAYQTALKRIGAPLFTSLGVNTTFPTWSGPLDSTNQSNYLSAFVNLVNANRSEKNWGSVAPASVYSNLSAGVSLAGASKFSGGVNIPGGIIVGVPSGSTDVLRINTNDDTYSRVGSVTAGAEKFLEGCLAPNGLVYFCPYAASAVGIYNPSTHAVTYFDTTGPVATAFSGNLPGGTSYAGFYVGANGKLYAPPYHSATSVLVVNPANNSCYFIDTTGVCSMSGTLTESQKCDGAMVYGNYIYASPSTCTYVLKIDTANDICYKLDITPWLTITSASASNKWSTCVLAPNKMIYMYPYAASTIFKFDPATETAIEFGVLPGGSNGRWLGAQVMPDGNVYAIPGSNTQLLIHDPIDDSVFLFGSPGSGSVDCIGANLGVNGALYGIPSNKTAIPKYVVPGFVGTLTDDYLLSRYTNKY